MTPDAGVLAATALLTMGIGLAMGVVSAWQSVAVRVDEGLRPGRGSHRLVGTVRARLARRTGRAVDDAVSSAPDSSRRRWLTCERTIRRSSRSASSSPARIREPGDRELLPPEYYQTLVTELAHMPGADAAALSVYYPTYFGLTVAVPTDYHYTRADGVTPLDGTVLTEFVSPGFFDLFRLQLLKGRDVSWDDGPGKPAVALVSASLARAVFPAGDAIGQHIRIAGPDRRDVEVIGVVADAPYVKLDDPRPLVVFRPITAGNGDGRSFRWRTSARAATSRRCATAIRASSSRSGIGRCARSSRRQNGSTARWCRSASRRRWPHSRRRSRSCWPAWACTGCSRTP